MKILHVLPTVDPRSGGPVEGVRSVGARLRQRGHMIEALTLDAPDEPFVAQFPLPVHGLGPSLGKYRYNRQLVPWLRRRAADYDAIVVDGLWQYHAFGSWLALKELDVPYVVFAHGMLDPWFKQRYPLKHLKKSLYWPWADYRLLRDARAVVFTCEEERRLARQSFARYRCTETIVAFGTAPPPQDGTALGAQFLAAFPSLRGKRLVLFVGRLHEKKGCDLLIDAFAREQGQDARLHLVVAGPDPGGLGSALRRQAQARGIGEHVSFTGMLQGDLKWGAFHAAEVFALPSHQENFGIVVAEALGCGKPVLISDKVNIWREIVQDGAGLAAPDTVDGAQDTLHRWLALSPDERRTMADAAMRCFRRRFDIDRMADSLLQIVEGLRSPPALAVTATGCV